MARKQRLDIALCERGLAQSRERARALILAGGVRVNGNPITKAGAPVTADDDIALDAADHPYVSRGALKLEAGLDATGIDPTGMTCLDIGASTGGFTDLLLRRGAAKVYAIDVGYGQLAWSLRQDPRVVVLERENVRYLDPDKVPGGADLAVIDVSFISLTLILERVALLLGAGEKPVLALVKPQFEAGRDEVGRGGVVRDPEIRAAAVARVQECARGLGFRTGRVVESPAPGPKGNIEYIAELWTPPS